MKKLCALLLVAVLCLGLVPFAVSADDNWSYTLVDGVLTITGTGAVGTPTSALSDYPWDAKREAITEIVVGDGITEIGKCAFSGCSSVTKITYGNTMASLQMDAMAHCTSLTEIIFNCPITRMEQGVVYQTNNVKKVTITGQTVAEFMAVVEVNYYNTSIYSASFTVAKDDSAPVVKQDIVICPWWGGTGWENWVNSPNNPVPGEQPGVTQMLVEIKDANGNKIDIDAALTWKVTISDGTTTKTITLSPATKALDYNLYRFETCFGEGENKFVPVAGTDYTVQVSVYNGEALAYESAAVSGFTVPGDLVPVDPDASEPEPDPEPTTPSVSEELPSEEPTPTPVEPSEEPSEELPVVSNDPSEQPTPEKSPSPEETPSDDTETEKNGFFHKIVKAIQGVGQAIIVGISKLIYESPLGKLLAGLGLLS